MPPSKSQRNPSSFVYGFCIVVCINVVVLVYIVAKLAETENQMQREMLRRTEDIRRMQLIDDYGRQNGRRMKMNERVHYGKTEDQRVEDQYGNVYTEKYLDVQRLDEWVLNFQNENMKKVQDQRLQYRVEQEPKVLNEKERDRNMQEEDLIMQDKMEQELKVSDQKEQDLNMQVQKEHGLKEQGLKEQDHNEQGMNIQDIKEQDPKLQDQSVYEEQDLKVQQRKEEKDKHLQGEENQDIQDRVESIIIVQDQGTQFPKMENNEKLQEKQQKGNVQDQEEHNNIGIHIRDEHDKEKASQDNTNEQDLKQKGVAVRVEDEHQGILNLKELDRKKQEQGKQYEKEQDLKVQHPTEENQDIMRDSNQRHATTQAKEDQNGYVQGWKKSQDLKDKKKLPVPKQIVQDTTEQEFQEIHQLNQDLESHADHDLNAQMMRRPNGQGMKVDSQLMTQDQTGIGRLLFNYKHTAELLRTQHPRWQQQKVNDQQLREVTEASEVSEVETVPTSEILLWRMIKDSRGSEQEIEMTTALDDKSQDLKTSSPSTD